MKIVEKILELIPDGEGPPVFDVEVNPYMPGVPGLIRHVFGVIRKSDIVAAAGRQRARIITCVVVAVDPELPVEKRRFGLMTPGGEIPPDLAEVARWCGTFFIPEYGMPISVYEFPFDGVPVVDEAGPDIMAALAATAKAAEGPVVP